MVKYSRIVALALCTLTLAACASGPWKLSRSWDDKVNALYAESTWVHGVLLQDILPAYPIVGLGAAIVDVLFVNPWYFWVHDAWSGSGGTAFVHTNPVEPAHAVGSYADPEPVLPSR